MVELQPKLDKIDMYVQCVRRIQPNESILKPRFEQKAPLSDYGQESEKYGTASGSKSIAYAAENP